MRYLSLAVGVLSFCLSTTLGAQTRTATASPPPVGGAKPTASASGSTLPADKMELPATLDAELEQLLDRWYEGYGARSTGNKLSTVRGHQPIPNVSDSTYMAMLNRIPTAMPMNYNPLVRESIELYLFRRRPLLSTVLSLADLYFPEIETILEQQGLPLELKYLTIVESSLNPTAVSSMGASGLWQLMLPTARIYGLQINSLVDERLDPVKSTVAAGKLLADLNRIYGDWWLALAAYNCGPGNVNRAIRRTGMERPSFWDVYPHLPRETRRYVPLFIGAYFAMYYHQHYDIKPRAVGNILATEVYTVRDQITTEHLAQLSRVPEEQIRALNPQFRRGIIPGNTQPYDIRLPLAGVMALESLSPDSIRTDELSVRVVDARESERDLATAKGKKGKDSAKAGKQYYKVRKGDTLGSIAKRRGVTVAQLRRWNGLKGNKLKVGQRIVVSA